MVGTFSPQSDSGGTLHFPSPTHIHHVDPSSAFRQLRRSLSRSPSKVSAFRLVTSKSTSPSPQSPLSPPRAQTPVRSLSENLLSPSTSTPNPSSTRRIRQPARKLSPLRHSSRPSSSHRSPKKRTLQESASSGNATPRSSAEPSEDQENRKGRSLSPVGDPMIDVTFKADLPVSQSSPFAPPRATARFEREYNSWSAKSSPLKRSDGRVNWDQGCGASPSAKRRSLHGGIFSPDFDIFDQAAASDSQADTQMTNTPCDTDRSLTKEYASPLPSRTSSLRKTTLQQRQEKPFSSRKQHTDSTLDPSSPAHPLSKARSRMSLESVLPSMPRDSPFSSQGSLLNASVHPMFQQAPKAHDPRLSSQPQRHPLSRTISQSTSASSMAEDSPTHIPVRQAEQRRPFVDFSKSLPVGTNRPPADESQTDSQTSNFSFATPENYKLVKPLPAAFMSTGLISKRHKHPEPAQPNFGASTSTMPDTPCKRHSLAEIPSPSASREAFAVKPHPVRHSFGNPSTPFHSQNSHATPASFGQGVGIFGSSVGKGRLQRSASFLDVESDEPLSPSRNTDSQSSAEFEVPPTPTRIFGSVHNGQPAPFRGSVRKPKNGEQVNGSLADSPPLNVSQQPTCKLSSPWEAMENVDEDSDDKMGDSPSVSLRFRHFFPLQRSFTHSRLLRQSKSPTPLNRASLTAPALLARRSLAKRSPLSPASPQENRSFRWSPRTPKDNMIPPDPSGLSISQLGDEHVQSLNKIASSASIFPPATPTASKDLFARSRASATPSHIPAPVEVDPVLTSRFDKVELIGTGEFSQVFRVSRKQDSKNVSGYFSMPLAHKSPKTPLPDRVWAVKKTRNQYIGPKDRQRKLREVEALKALGQAEHTVELIDSWEHHNRLYMQTEFCEEGSLDVFLERKGFKARLDDFRIWKILLELSFVRDVPFQSIHLYVLTACRA